MKNKIKFYIMLYWLFNREKSYWGGCNLGTGSINADFPTSNQTSWECSSSSLTTIYTYAICMNIN